MESQNRPACTSVTLVTYAIDNIEDDNVGTNLRHHALQLYTLT